MNPLTIVQDSLYFFRTHLFAIVRLCLPLLVLQSLAEQLVDQHVESEARGAFDILVGLLFYPIYTGALILYLDSRSNGEQPPLKLLLAMGLRLWPRFALLAAISSLAILLGMALYLLPGLWLMARLAFAEYLLVLRGLGPWAAIKQSFELTRGPFWRVLGCVLAILVPLWLIDYASAALLPDEDNLALSLAVDCVNGLLQLLTTVVLFRLFMLVTDPTLRDSRA
ncbi:YciC family protein [Pseudomonas sp. RIT-PI-S]|uniref:YciC family protein n=1 Tax=Pseudomonas sp. RIT-PI-S TaxID=3035295 RepID=UPI0021D9C078|nr:YciC family protein [Pseudomonas sp. RIT-PI-S]